jgi:hypothetical protein
MVLPERSSINFGPNVPVERYSPAESLTGLFAQFDRGTMSLRQFIEAITALGFEQTPDFARLVSGNCTFTLVELVKALKKSDKENFAFVRKPEIAGKPGNSLTLGSLDRCSYLPTETSIFDAIAAVAKGAIDGQDFRKFLVERDVEISAELDRILRLHAADNSQTFQDFAKVLKRQGANVARPNLAQMSSRASTTYSGESEAAGAVASPRPAHPTRGLKSHGNHGNFIAWN